MLGWKLCFIIKQISCFKIMSTFLGISTWKVFGSFATTSLLSPMFTAIIIKIRLNVAFFLVILLCWSKRCSICLIFIFSLYELRAAFVCANNKWRLVNSLFGVNIFNPFPFFTYLSTSSCTVGSKSATSVDIMGSLFQGINLLFQQ